MSTTWHWGELGGYWGELHGLEGHTCKGLGWHWGKTGSTGGHWEHWGSSGGSRGHWDVLGGTGLYWADPISPTAAYPAAYGLVSPAFAPPGPLLAPPPPPQQQQREGEELPQAFLGASWDPETSPELPQTSCDPLGLSETLGHPRTFLGPHNPGTLSESPGLPQDPLSHPMELCLGCP